MKYEPFLRDGSLCWTLTSNGYKYLTWNFVLHWRNACPGQPILVVCADKPSYQFLQREGISCRLIDDAMADFGPQIVPFGSRQFMSLNRLKLKLLDTFANDASIQQCIYLDGDIAVYQHVAQDLVTRLQTDVTGLLFQCDEQHQTCSGPSCPNICTGCIAFRHGADKGCFKITDETVWKEKPEDQVWVNQALARLHISYTVLPRELYPNGTRCSLTHSDLTKKSEAKLLHYNYRVGNAKVADMKRFGDWLLPY
jgi:hypothetical protein